MRHKLGTYRGALLALVMIVTITAGTGRVSVAGGSVEQRISDFWKRVDAMQPSDRLSAADLGQWALNVIERDPSAGITVAEFRVATAGMQAAMDRAGRLPVAPPTPSPSPAAIILKAGANVAYTDGWKITLLRSESQSPSTYSTPKPGMQFVAVIVRYDNGTAKQASFNEFDWAMQDSSGVRRIAAFFLGRNDDLNSGQLAPGSFVQGSIVFEAPVGDARLSVIYQKYGYQLATWQLY